MKTKEAVVFGAGNIGRGFLGDLLHRSGYRITFVDVDAGKIQLLNQEKEYQLITVSSETKVERVITDVAAVQFQDAQNLKKAVVDADLILTAVGKRALAHVAKPLAGGLVQRLKQRPGDGLHTIVLACENVQDNTSYLRSLVSAHITPEEMGFIEQYVSFPNCVVDRIVPNICLPNPLAVSVEDYFQLVVDETALLSPFPAIEGVEFSPDLHANLEQKLFTLNMAHAIVAYFGYLRGSQYIHEAVQDPMIQELVKGALEEVAALLVERNPSITGEKQAEYAAKILGRFENPHLADEVVRVARDPKRKLGNQDRLVRPAELYQQRGTAPAYLTTGIVAALRYDFPNDSQAREITESIRENGVERVLHEISGIPEQSELARMVKADYLLRGL